MTLEALPQAVGLCVYAVVDPLCIINFRPGTSKQYAPEVCFRQQDIGLQAPHSNLDLGLFQDALVSLGEPPDIVSRDHLEKYDHDNSK